MATNMCSVCNTELLDNLIFCYGRCNKFFHYTCIGMSRTIFDGYKKVEGLRWQCPDCINEFNGIWAKLDDLTTLVNEIKTTINLYGMVKSAIGEVLRDKNFADHSSEMPYIPSTDRPEEPTLNKNKRKRKKRQNNQSSTPLNTHILESTSHTGDPILPTVNLDSSVESSNNITIVQSTDSSTSRTIRTAENRTYLWLNGFHHQTTTNQIIDMVVNTMEVREADIICRSLKSSRRTYTELDRISFRVGLKAADVKDALTAGKWPNGVVCKLFKSKNLEVRQPVKLG